MVWALIKTLGSWVVTDKDLSRGDANSGMPWPLAPLFQSYWCTVLCPPFLLLLRGILRLGDDERP